MDNIPEDTEERRFSERRLIDRLDDRRPESALMRAVDFRIPLWGVILVMGSAVGALISTYYQLQRVDENLKELQTIVRSGNIQTVTFASEIALMRFRIENIENSRAREHGEPSIRR